MTAERPIAATFNSLWEEQLPIGRHNRTGGYRRYAWTEADLACREWFDAAARARGLMVETDRNGNLWAWWGDPEATDVVAVGSHLDSVPDGGPFDGPLGVVTAFAAVDALRARGASPRRPIAVAAFSDEEGARFGVACAGSRLAAGTLDADRARALRDADGTTMADAMRRGGHAPAQLGPDRTRLSRLAAFVELHVEQGRGLVDLGAPLGVADTIWPHGRWRFEFAGEANHAGTTRLADRRDPTLPYACTVLAAQDVAERLGALATFGKVRIEPNGTNAVPSRVTAWLDARAADEPTVRALVAEVTEASNAEVDEESWTQVIKFPVGLRDRLSALLGGAPVLSTGAGHDAGILAASGVPTAMVFVRNPTGVSHSPAEHAERADCLAGAAALTEVLQELACR